MKKLWLYALILILPASSALAVDLRISGDRIYLQAREEPLQSILRRLSQQGIRVRVDPQLNPLVSANFADRDLREAIAEIVKPYDHVLVWEKTPAGTSFFRLAEIQVFRPGKKEAIQDLSPRAFSLARDQKDGSMFVKDEILLRLKPGTNIETLLRRIGGTIIDKNEALGIYKVRLPPDSDIPAIRDQIAASPGIVQAGPDFVYPVTGLYPSDLPSHATETATGFRQNSKVSVAVLDSGLLPEVGAGGFVIAQLDAVSPDQPMTDNIGHGTQMALLASGLIKPSGAKKEEGGQIPVIAIRAMDDNGYTSDFTILKSIDFALEKGARVISLSWGSEKRSDFLEIILDYAASKGAVIVASAGNEPTGKPVYPAAYPSVIGVGAAYPSGQVWEQSNYGSSVDLYAPGFATMPVGYKGEPGIYGGTSVAAAFAANRIAAYLTKNPESGLNEIRKALNLKKAAN